MCHLFRLVAPAVGLGITLFIADARGADDQQELQETERKWADAVQRNDPDEIGKYLHVDFTFINPRGKFLHRIDHLDDFRQGRTVFTKVELSEVQIRVYGDAAVITSRPVITGFAVTPGGKTIFAAQQARFTDTLIRSKGKWQSVARHMSLVVE